MSERRSAFINGVVATLIGTILGFGLGIAWDIWKDWRKDVKERDRATLLVRDEIDTNLALLEEVLRHLSIDLEAAKGKKLVLDAVPVLPREAWQAVRLSGTFSPSVADLGKEIALTYHDIAVLNQRIQARELFKATSQSLDRFHEQRVMINDGLLNNCEQLRTRLKEHRKALGGSS